jgi:2-methylcitrate dehydratase PrpD
MTALETMAAFIARGVRGGVPAATRATAKRHVIDTVGAWIAGARTAEGRALIASPALAMTGSDTVCDVGIHCALSRLSEIDNIHLASSITPGSIVIPTALTIAANRSDTDTEALLEAIVAGTEAMVRLGLAISGPTVLYRGIWPTYFAAPFGVAAAAARLDNLDAEQTAHALALALTFASPGVGHHNAASTSRWFAIGHAARNGLIAVGAAQTGFTSDLNLLEGSFLDGIYGITPNVTAFTENLGQRFALDDISFKPWCAARQTIAATQALLEIIESGVSPDAIVSVEVHVPPPYLKMINHGVKVGDRASHLTSVQYHLALAARDLSALYDVEHSPQRIADDVQAFMQKVSVSADEALLAHYPKAWPARVVVHTSGAMQELIVIHGWGDPQRPFDDRRIEEKFRRILAPTTAACAQRLLARCRAVFDTSRSPAALAQDIARVTGRAFKT